MNKKDRQQARKHGIETAFHSWCQQKKVEPSPDTLIDFDKERELKLFDYEKAKKEGYYLHLRMQAVAMIASWAKVVYVKPAASSTPSVFSSKPRPARSIRVQSSYEINGRMYTLKEIVESEELLLGVIRAFRDYVFNKSERLRYFINQHDDLTIKQKKTGLMLVSAATVLEEAIQGGLEKAERILKS